MVEMHMTFWWDYKVSDYLFKGLSTHSIGGLIGICLAIASMSFLLEFMRYLQAKQRQKELKLRSEQLKTICPTESSTLLTETPAAGTSNPSQIVTVKDRALLFGSDISLWFLLQNVSYILMLSVMLYNGWFMVAAVIGGGLGYFVCGQMFMQINLQNCQIIRDTWCMQKCGQPGMGPTNGETTPVLGAASTSGALNCHEVVASVHVECH